MKSLLDRLRGTVADRVLDAAEVASEHLRTEGLPHALCGGLAVSVHGYERTTKDVDFLVGDEAFVHEEGGIVRLRVPIVHVNGVPIYFVAADEVSARVLPPEAGDAMPVVSPEVLAYLKLKASRLRDKDDLEQLVRLGKLDPQDVADWLTAQAGEFVQPWREIVRRALENEA